MKTDPGADFQPISPNPYIVGNPVRDPSMFFGREAEFELIQKRFCDANAEGGLIVLCGERRSGKTSILFQITNGRLGPDFVPVLVDMQSMAIENERDFLAKIIAEITQATERASEPLPPSTPGRAASQFREVVRRTLAAHPGKRLLLLFDEYELFENKIEAGVLSEEVLQVFAHLIESQRVFLVFTGSLNLEERHREYWQVFLGKSIYRQISFLERRDALRLITEPVQGRVRYAEGLVETIYRLTAGQAFYTQAVCQNLVDQLNEKHRNAADQDLLDVVVNDIVSNPFPQMIFRWEGLTRDEKAVLALLAETLPTGDQFAGVGELVQLLSRGKYPLALDRDRLATTLEGLFRADMLLKNQSLPAGYAFRMDLWRRWVQRMHSVWQVVRELGISTRSARRTPTALLAGVAALLCLIAAAAWIMNANRPNRAELDSAWKAAKAGRPGTTFSGGAAAESAMVDIAVTPPGARIIVDGIRTHTGRVRERMSSGPHSLSIFAKGYASMTDTFDVNRESGYSRDYKLETLMGNVTVNSNPPGAAVIVDGALLGSTPYTISNLDTDRDHNLEVRAEGLGSFKRTLRAIRDSTIALPLLDFTALKASIRIETSPIHAAVILDGRPMGLTPVALDLSPRIQGYDLRVEATGYLPFDTTLTIREPTPSALNLNLKARLAALSVHGDKVLEIWLDDDIIMKELPRVTRNIEPGDHHLLIIRSVDDTLRKAFTALPGGSVDFDFQYNRFSNEPAKER